MVFECCNTEDDSIARACSADLNKSLVTFSGSHEEDESVDDRSRTFDCDYKDVTPLFKAIEDEDWKNVLVFLTTEKWGGTLSSFAHMQSPSPEIQARTWVSSTDNKGNLQWSQLPIHAAISYMAPLPVVQKLVELHPSGLRSTDDTGNLPLHLAFGFGSPDAVVAYLIQQFPKALSLRGLQNRLPVECSDLGSNKLRGEIIKACQDHTRNLMMKEWEHHWKRTLLDANKKSGLKERYSGSNKTLEDVFEEFMEVKKELQNTKRNVRNRPTMIITKTEPVSPVYIPAAPKTVGHTPTDRTSVFSFTKRNTPTDRSNVFQFVKKASSKVHKSTKGMLGGKKSASVMPVKAWTP